MFLFINTQFTAPIFDLVGNRVPLSNHLIYFAPEILLSVTCLMLLMIIAIANFKFNWLFFFKHKYLSVKLILNSIISLKIISILYCYLIVMTGTNVLTLSIDYLSYNTFNLVFKLLVLSTGIFILKNSVQYILKHLRNCIEYSFLILLALFFLVMLISSSSLILVFISIIGFSLNLYILVIYDTPYHPALEAAAKYFYLSALSSGLMVSGIFLMYLWFNWNKFWLINITLEFIMSADSSFAQQAPIGLPHGLPISNHILNLGVIALFSVIFGFLFKLGAFPCHLWVPEVYDGAPNPVMVFLVLPVKIATFIIFIKLLNGVFRDFYIVWSYLIWTSSILSMIWGCLSAYGEDKIKKFIAYTGINQMGFLFIGIVCCSFDSLVFTIFYLLMYVLMNWSFLQIYLNIVSTITFKNIEFLTEFQYYRKNNLVWVWILTIILFSMASVPPLGGFFSKFFIFWAAFNSEYYFLVIVGMFTGLISTFYYLRIIKIMWFEKTYNIFLPKLYHYETIISKNDRISLFLRTCLICLTIFILEPVLALIEAITVGFMIL